MLFSVGQGLLLSFLRRKGRGGRRRAPGAAACTTHPEPPCPMPLGLCRLDGPRPPGETPCAQGRIKQSAPGHGNSASARHFHARYSACRRPGGLCRQHLQRDVQRLSDRPAGLQHRELPTTKVAGFLGTQGQRFEVLSLSTKAFLLPMPGAYLVGRSYPGSPPLDFQRRLACSAVQAYRDLPPGSHGSPRYPKDK